MKDDYDLKPEYGFSHGERGKFYRPGAVIRHAGESTATQVVHPGTIIREDFLRQLGLSVTDAANVLGVPRPVLNNVVQLKAGVSPELAIRLSQAFGGTPETWLHAQMNYDLAQARKLRIKVKRYKKAS